MVRVARPAQDDSGDEEAPFRGYQQLEPELRPGRNPNSSDSYFYPNDSVMQFHPDNLTDPRGPNMMIPVRGNQMAGNDPLQMLMQVAGPLLQKGGAGGLSPEMKGQIGQALQSPQIQQMIGQVLQGAAGGGGGVQGSGDGMPTPQGSGMGQGGDGSYYANGRYYQKGIDTPGMGPDQANSGYMMLMDRAMRGSQEMPSNGGDPNVMAIIQSMLDRAPGASRSIGGGPMPDMNPQGSMGPGDQRGAPQDQLPTGASGQQLMGQYIKAQDAPTDTNVEDLAAMRGYPPGMKGLSEEQILEYVQHMMGEGIGKPGASPSQEQDN